jgi:hypothetical protein
LPEMRMRLSVISMLELALRHTLTLYIAIRLSLVQRQPSQPTKM